MASDDELREVWYCLMASNGKATSPYDYLTLIPSATSIAKFRKAVKAENSVTLLRTDALQLRVFMNKESLAESIEHNLLHDNDVKGPLDEESVIVDLGRSRSEALMVVAPEQHGIPKFIASSPYRRWKVLADRFPRIALPFDFPRVGQSLAEWENQVKKGIFCTIQSMYHDSSGLAAMDSDMMLYCRRAFLHQVNEMQYHAIYNHAISWVVGPSGSGKSCAAFVFALSLDVAVWNVIWISYSNELQLFHCVRFDGDRKATLKISGRKALMQIRHLLDCEQPSDNKKTIVFFDGYVRSCKMGCKAFAYCMNWQKKNVENCRLVCICSMVSLGKHYRPDTYETILASDGHTGYKSQEIWMSQPWLLDEYLAAVKNTAFYNSVQKILVNKGQEQLSRDELVISKFYITGGNARFMFNETASTVMSILKRALELAPNMMRYIGGTVRQHAYPVLNHLLSVQLDKNGDNMKASILSSYIGTELAIRAGPKMVLTLKSMFSNQMNTFMDGHLLAWWFFARLAHKTIKLEGRGDTVSKKWYGPNYIVPLDADERIAGRVLTDMTPIWLRPRIWNNGGYDAVYLAKAPGLVCFVQVMRGDSHCFKSQSFCSMLTKLTERHERRVPVMTVKRIELVYVVPFAILDAYHLVDVDTFKRDVVDNFVNSNEDKTVEWQVEVYGLKWDRVHTRHKKRRRVED